MVSDCLYTCNVPVRAQSKVAFIQNLYVIAQVQLVHVLYSRDIYIHANDSAICRMHRTVDHGECFYGGPIIPVKVPTRLYGHAITSAISLSFPCI